MPEGVIRGRRCFWRRAIGERRPNDPLGDHTLWNDVHGM